MHARQYLYCTVHAGVCETVYGIFKFLPLAYIGAISHVRKEVMKIRSSQLPEENQLISTQVGLQVIELLLLAKYNVFLVVVNSWADGKYKIFRAYSPANLTVRKIESTSLFSSVQQEAGTHWGHCFLLLFSFELLVYTSVTLICKQTMFIFITFAPDPLFLRIQRSFIE